MNRAEVELVTVWWFSGFGSDFENGVGDPTQNRISDPAPVYTAFLRRLSWELLILRPNTR